MTKPTLRDETEIHEYDCYYAACNEQRLESLGSDMGNVTGCSIDSVYVIGRFIVETYGMVSPSLMVVYIGFPSAAQVDSMATNVATKLLVK